MLSTTATDPRIHELKQLALKFASKAFEAGSHFLWEAAGDTPGNADGAAYRRGNVKLHPNVPDLSQNQPGPVNPNKPPYLPILLAAYVAKTSTVCAGNPISASLPYPRNVNAATASNLTLKNVTPQLFAVFKSNLSHPDDWLWPRPDGAVGAPPGQNLTVWGESCAGKRHFDSYGFVNWCLSSALRRTVRFEFIEFTNLVQVIPVSEVQMGDIVSNGWGCGLVTADELVIRAREFVGVILVPIAAERWTRCTRLSDSLWHL